MWSSEYPRVPHVMRPRFCSNANLLYTIPVVTLFLGAVMLPSGCPQGSTLSVLMRAASNYILSCVETGSSLGIVQFNTNATALSPMIQINTEEDRQRLIRSLPRQAEGKTSIGAGLEKGLEVREG